MITALMMALIGAPAAAADHQIDLELGSQVSGHEAWDFFSESPGLNTLGARVGLGLGQHLSLVASYQRGATGTDVSQEAWDEPDSAPGDLFTAAYFSHTLAAGPKVSFRANRSLSPYGLALITGQYATVRMDADPVIDDDATQLTETGWAPGGVLAAGLDAAMPFNERSWTPATFLELGYGHSLALKFDTLGELTFSGLYFRWGLGVRF